MVSHSPSLERLLQRLNRADPPRAKSLCVSFLGDALIPHGGAVWLGDLIELLEPLGINERLLRTSVFRLVAQGWLHSERHGRRSLYRVSAQGERRTAHAYRRIYDGAAPEWNGVWTLVVLPRLTQNGLVERAELRRALEWEGFGMVAPGVFAHPRVEASTAHDVLESVGIPDKALVLAARDLAGAGGLPLSDLAPHCWNLADLADQYRQFSRQFGPLRDVLADAEPAYAFAARMLLLHRWRRIVLHDPQLPAAMLPQQWPGHAARELCGKLYWAAYDASESHLAGILSRDNTHYRDARPETAARFGGRP